MNVKEKVKEFYYVMCNKLSKTSYYMNRELYHIRKVFKCMNKLETVKFSGEKLDGYKFIITKLEKE